MAEKSKSELYKEWIAIPGNRELKNAKTKEWRERNSEKVKDYRRRYRQNPVVKVYENYMRKIWIANNPEKVKATSFRAYLKKVESGFKQMYDKEYRDNIDNKAKRNNRSKIRLCQDDQYRIGIQISGMTHRYTKGIGKSNAKLIGCSFLEFRSHIESKFTQGMTWENYGKWHIDHIRPITSFDLTSIEEYLACVNYQNIQPLWAMDNMKKGSKIF